MAGNSFGKVFRITSFGESHGPYVGVCIDGCPSGLKIDIDFIRKKLQQRRPGQSGLTTSRTEREDFQIISGVFEGISLGTPITILIPNEDTITKDYDQLKNIYRPSHADYTYDVKYGIRDHRGGGRSSARETVARVAAGAIAQMLLHTAGVVVFSYTRKIGKLELAVEPDSIGLKKIYTHDTRCPDLEMADKMSEYIREIKAQGDTVGGIIETIVTGMPAGLGEPVFDKLNADLGKGILSINACKGIEFGSGFKAAGFKGSEHNDIFINQDGDIKTTTNHSGGIQGGISNGMNLVFRAVFKPVSTIQKTQATLNINKEATDFIAGGRHDPCVIPRAVPIVEAMTSIVLADHLLRNKLSRIS